MEQREFMLSTVDNPFNPFEDFDSWRMFDMEKGYYSCERLARCVNLAEDRTQLEENKEIERAIDEIIKYDFTDTYCKVSRPA